MPYQYKLCLRFVDAYVPNCGPYHREFSYWKGGGGECRGGGGDCRDGGCDCRYGGRDGGGGCRVDSTTLEFSLKRGGILRALGLENVGITGEEGGDIMKGPEKFVNGSRSSSSVKLDKRLLSSESTSQSMLMTAVFSIFFQEHYFTLQYLHPICSK